MSPETTPQLNPIHEAERIKDSLLRIQERAAAVAEQTELQLLENVREDLGYKPTTEINEDDIVDTRIAEKTPVLTPKALAQVLPVTEESANTTRKSRSSIEAILSSKDDRLVAIVGPCSIHDAESALEYASWLYEQREFHKDNLEIVMRAYMAKPRTELGWKGFEYDPRLDDSNDINLGIVLSRMLSCQITNLGMPIAMERLNANTPQYFNGLVAYDAIGARNTTDQKAREYASGTSSPVGFKNTPEGSIQAAAEAVVAANAPHDFLGMNMQGTPMQVTTTGNVMAHIILRGSQEGPNYFPAQVEAAKNILRDKKLLEAILIDAAHANSNKDFRKQAEVISNVSHQIALGEVAIKGVMIESNLVEGSQSLDDQKNLVYGQSITDGCVGLAETEKMLNLLSDAVNLRRLQAS
jgi:3-deoxy-7-phosphoheptulonate synthase